MNYIPIVLAFAILGVLGVIFGIVLTIAEKKFAVEADPRVTQVRACLGGANCGACGYAGCDAFAEAVVAGEAKPNGCPPAGAKGAEAIAAIMGSKVTGTGEPVVARLLCQGAQGVAKDRYEYDGYKSCAVAASLAGGPKTCRFSCIGLGDCVKACTFDAISIKDRLAQIDADKCTACGMCVKKCPRNVISLMPVKQSIVLSCRNTDSGREARAACMKACIACGRCEKACPNGAIKVEGGIAHIDDTKCVRCGACAKVCPCKCIVDLFAEDHQ